MFNSYAQQGGSSFQGGGESNFKKKPGFKKSFQKAGKKFNKWGGADRSSGSSFKKPFHAAFNPGQDNGGSPQGGFNQRPSY